MRRSTMFIFLLFVMVGGCTSDEFVTQTRVTRYASAGTLLYVEEFDALAGPTWRGTLTYLDYTSNKPTTIRSTLLVQKVSTGVWSWATGYNDEPHADSASEVRLVESDRAIKSGDTIERVVWRIDYGDHVEITTEHDSTDNNRPATIQRVYNISPGRFSIRKLVKVEGEGEFFERHVYNWSR